MAMGASGIRAGGRRRLSIPSGIDRHATEKRPRDPPQLTDPTRVIKGDETRQGTLILKKKLTPKRLAFLNAIGVRRNSG